MLALFLITLQPQFISGPNVRVRHFSLTEYQSWLKNYPRPLRQLSESEALVWFPDDVFRDRSSPPPIQPRKFRANAVKSRDELLDALKKDHPFNRWEIFELYIRKDLSTVPALYRAALRGNPLAVTTVAHIQPSNAELLKQIVQSAPEVSRVVAGVLLGASGDRSAVREMRLAYEKYPDWVHSTTVPNLIRWVDKDDIEKLRIYAEDRRTIPILGEVKTNAAIRVITESMSSKYNENRKWALQELVRIEPEKSRNGIRKALFDDVPRHRQIAGEWFIEHGNRFDLPNLKKSLQTIPKFERSSGGGSKWRQRISEAIQRIERKN